MTITRTWNPSGVHGGGGFNLVAPVSPTPGKFWLGTDVGGPSITEDYGDNWKPRKSGLLDRNASACASFWVDPTLFGDHVITLTGIASAANDDTGTGAVYETFDSGLSWQRKSTQIMGCGNGNITTQATGPRSIGNLMTKIGSTFYAGSFFPRGVYKAPFSTLNGWTLHALDDDYIRCLVPDPSDSASMLVGLSFRAATTHYGVWRVDNLGNATPLVSGLPSNCVGEEIATCSTCGQWYVSLGVDGVYTSTNFGATWTASNGSGGTALPTGTSQWAPISVQHNASSGSDEILVGCTHPVSVGSGQFGSVFLSTNSGGAWTCVTTPGANVSTTIKGHGITWWESIDTFGLTKVLGQSGAAVHSIAWDPNNQNRAMIATQGTPWYFDKTASPQWQPAAWHATITKHSIGAANPSDENKVFITSDDWAEFYSTDGLATIDQGKPNGIADVFGVSIGTDGNTYIAAGSAGGKKILFNSNPASHNTWTDTVCTYTSDGRCIIDGADGSGTKVILVGTAIGIWRGVKTGGTFTSHWTQVLSGPGNTASIARFAWAGNRTGAVVFAVGQSGVWKSIDYGASWTLIWTTSISGTSGFDVDTDGHVWVGIGVNLTLLGGQHAGGDAAHLNTTDTVENLGITKTTFPGFGIQAFCVSETNTTDFYIVGVTATPTGATLQFTTDFGAHWTDITTPEFKAGVVDALWLWVQGTRIYATTDGQGAYTALVTTTVTVPGSTTEGWGGPPYAGEDFAGVPFIEEEGGGGGGGGGGSGSGIVTEPIESYIGSSVHEYRVVVNDLSGTALEEIQTSNLQYSFILNGPGAVSFVCNPRDKKVTSSLIQPGAREIVVYRDNTPFWGGYLWSFTANDQGVQVSGEGWFSRIKRRLISDTLKYTNIDQFDIAWGLIDYTQNLTNGAMGITRDSSTLSGILRKRTYHDWERKNVGEALEELAAVIDGFDFEITPDKRWKTYFPTKGQTSDVVYALGKNIRGISWDLSAGTMVTEMTAIGSGSDSDTLLAVSSNLTQQLTYGLLQDTVSFLDVKKQDTLQDHADEELAIVDTPFDQPQIQIILTEDTPIGGVSVGDTFLIDAQSDFFNIYKYYRCTAITVAVSNEGREAVGLFVDEHEV